MKRYYVNRRIGMGGHDDPYRSELRVFIQTTFGIKPLKQVIAHTCAWVLMKYDLTEEQHALVMSTVPDVSAFPEGALDREVSTLPAAVRQAIRDKLDAIGLDQSWIDGSTRVRAILRYIAVTIQLSEWAGVAVGTREFDARMTVADIPAAARNRLSQHVQDLGISTDGITGATSLAEVIQRVEFHQDGETARLYRGRRWFYHDEDTD